MERQRALPAVIPLVRSFRRLGRSSRPLCVSALAFNLLRLASPVPSQEVSTAAVPAPPPLIMLAAAETPARAPLDAIWPAAIASPPPQAAAQRAPDPFPPTVATAPDPEPSPASPSTAAADAPESLRQSAEFVVRVEPDSVPPASPYSDLIHDVAVRHSVSPHLVAALIDVESNFNPRAVSRKGACGLMQVLPATARRFGVRRKKDLFDPVKNLEAGVGYLRWLTDRFGGDVHKILAAYNAGEGAVDRFGGIPPYRETQRYVQRIVGLLGMTPAVPLSGTAAPAVEAMEAEAGR